MGKLPTCAPTIQNNYTTGRPSMKRIHLT